MDIHSEILCIQLTVIILRPSRCAWLSQKVSGSRNYYTSVLCSLYHFRSLLLLPVEELFTSPWLSEPRGYITLRVMLHVSRDTKKKTHMQKQRFNDQQAQRREVRRFENIHSG